MSLVLRGASGLVAVGLLVVGAVPTRAATPSGELRFNRDIRPILAENCLSCHGPDAAKRKGKLRLDDREGLFGQPGRKPPVVPGHPEQSELFSRITTTNRDDVMPPPDSRRTVKPEQLAKLKRWIEQGAPFEGHWAYEPIHRPPVPPAPVGTANPIDAFIAGPVKAAGLTPAPEADPRTLLRRLSFDLTGLPPTPDEVARYTRDHGSQAYARTVDRLIDSPHFGERMALFWLDLVRYSDTDGFHADNYRSVWPYRDYVIRSFNANVPFDRFTLEQLAGDLLPEATLEQRVASTYNRLNRTTEEGGAQAKDFLARYASDRVRTTAGAWLGTTMGCAECHNHKYDPFTMRDFYRLEAYFADISEVGVGVPASTPLPNGEQAVALRNLDTRLAELQRIADTSTPALVEAQNRWEETLQRQPLPRMGEWLAIGPFPGADFAAAFRTAFPPESDPDPAHAHADGRLKWTPRPAWADGKVHGDLPGENAATYLQRTITAETAQPLALSLGSDDGIKVWINGREVLAREVNRPAAPDQEKITVDLRAGENRLLIKIVNGAGGAGFYFKAGPGLPDTITTILAVAAKDRTEAQTTELAKYFRSVAPELAETRAELAEAKKRREELVKRLPTTLATVSVAPRTIRVLPRGNWMDDSGEVVTPGLPAAFTTAGETAQRPSRLDLARWLVARDNPLTARVFVNRLWRLYYGVGLAKTVDDLGTRGDWPSNPELLDWLAAEFIDSGWDVKHMVRLMVTSRTYRQSSDRTPAMRQKDPENRLLAAQNSFRLDAELVRDNALAVSGLLNDRIGGPSVKPYQPTGYWDFLNFPKRTWESDHGDALYRRGLYTFWCRTFLHPSLLAFDAPSREDCTALRTVSNTPLQALTLLNDPTYVEAARSLAERVVREGGDDPAARVRWLFACALQRSPEPVELEPLLALEREAAARYRQDPEGAKALLQVGEHPADTARPAGELAAWTAVTRVVLNLHETITRY